MADLEENHDNGPVGGQGPQDAADSLVAAVSPVATEQDSSNNAAKMTSAQAVERMKNFMFKALNRETNAETPKKTKVSETPKTQTEVPTGNGLDDSIEDSLSDINDEPKLCIVEESDKETSSGNTENPATAEDTDKPECLTEKVKENTEKVQEKPVIEGESSDRPNETNTPVIDQPEKKAEATFEKQDKVEINKKNIEQEKTENQNDKNTDKVKDSVSDCQQETGVERQTNKPIANDLQPPNTQEKEKTVTNLSESSDRSAVDSIGDKPIQSEVQGLNTPDKKDDQDKTNDSVETISDDKQPGKTETVRTEAENVIPARGIEAASAGAASQKPATPSDRSAPFDWSSVGVHRCVNCKFTTDDTQLYKNHVTTCSSSKFNHGIVEISSSLGVPMTFACETCALTWTTKAEFEEHVVCHIIDSPYLCITCRKNFNSRYSIEKHAKNDHPNGDSRCALRGMKKCREYVKAVEFKGKYSFEGKLHIPRTPRNQMKDVNSGTEEAGSASQAMPNTTTKPATVSESVTEEKKDVEESSAAIENTATPTMPSPRPNLSKFMNTSITTGSEETGQLNKGKEVVTLSTATTSAPLNQPVHRGTAPKATIEYFPTTPTTASAFPPSSGHESNTNNMFQVMNTQSGTFQPLTLPSKIQKIVNDTSETTVRSEVLKPAPPPYQTKQFTNFTPTAPTPITSTRTPIWLIPVGPPVPLTQQRMSAPRSMAPSRQTAPLVQTTQSFQRAPSTVRAPLVLNTQQSNQIVFLRPDGNASQPVNAPQLAHPVNSSAAVTGANVLQTQAMRAPQTILTTSAATFAEVNKPRLPAPSPVSVGQPAHVSTLSTHNTPQARPALQQASTVATSSSASLASPLTANSMTSFVTVPSSGSKEEQGKKGLDKAYTFRIKPQKGFVCESCRKYTRDELVFRKHVWEHFHSGSTSCKYCKMESKSDAAKKGLLSCFLVNEIVCKLVKNSVKMNDHNEPIVIDITDDDDDDVVASEKVSKSKGAASEAVEVIVLDDDDTDNEKDSGLNIKITSTFSLSDADGFENMSKDAPDNKTGPKDTSYDHGETNNKNTDSKESDSKIIETNNKSPSVENKDEENLVIPVNDGDDNDDEEDYDDTTTVETDLVNKSLTEPDVSVQDVITEEIDKIFNKTLASKRCSKAEKKVKKENDSSANKKDASATAGPRNEEELLKVKAANKKRKFEAEVISNLGQYAFYMCGYELCSFSCVSLQSYKEHLQSKHRNELTNFVCCHCGRKDYNEDSHARHMSNHAGSSAKTFYLFKCPLRQCKYKTNLALMYKEHVEKHDEAVIKCVYCNKIFPSAKSLLEHLNQNLLKFISCPYCPFRFGQKHVVVKHIKMFHPDKPRMVTVTSQIVCQDREINFYVEPLAKKLEKTADKMVPGTDIMSITALLDEVGKNGDQVPEDDQEPMDVDLVSQPDTARKPDDGPPTISPEVRLGTRVSVKPKHKASAAGPVSLKCSKCSFLSYNLPLHIQHESLHQNEPERDRRFVCNLCPKGIDNLNQFKKHVSNHIGKNEIKVFSCNTCPYSSNLKCHIMDHCSDSHDGKGMYIQTVVNVTSSEASCKYCDFKARLPEVVAQHEELVHRVSAGNTPTEAEAPPVLEKQTNNKKSEGEVTKKKKYHCEYCQNFFKHKIDLKEHLENEHLDIEDKKFAFYKCKYCSQTSTMKDYIVEHMGKAHPGSEMRILRKIESVETVEITKEPMPEQQKEATATPTQPENQNIVKEKIGIPDGNTFKHPFKCTKCEFSSNLRITVMRHIKTHPELTPVREVQLNKTPKSTARKTTGQSQPEIPSRRGSALFQDIPSSQLQNPFADLKKDDKSPEAEIEQYALGEHDLHVKLSACFIPLENDLLFKCRICSRKIAKKFVLHRHVLDHLNIVFFKCRYCSEGTIEKSLLFGHMQREHPQKNLSYTKVTKAELDSQFKEKIFGQNFNDTISIESAPERAISPIEATGIVKKSVNEAGKVDVSPKMESKDRENSNKCPLCKYTSRKPSVIKKHILYHSDPSYNIVCTICEYRGFQKFKVLQHCYAIHGCAKIREDVEATAVQSELLKQEKKVKDDKKPEVAKSFSEEAQQTEEDKKRAESPASSSSVDEKDTEEEDTSKKNINKDFYMRTVYKCKECGIIRESISGLYKHISMEKKCNKPNYKCSLCAYKSSLKIDIRNHGRARHPGKKPAVVTLALKQKIRTCVMPVKIKGTSEERSVPGSVGSRSSSVTSEGSSVVKCQLCKYTCETVMTLQFHINTKHGGKLLYCQECMYKTPLVKHMINHCTNVHRQKEAIYRLEAKGAKSKASTPDDDSSSVTSSSLTEDSKTSASGKHLYCCGECNLTTDNIGTLRKHIRIHFNYTPFHCKYCNIAKYKTIINLKRHVLKEHPNRPVFKYNYFPNSTMENKVNKIFKTAVKKKQLSDMSTGASRPPRLDKLELVEEGIRKDGNTFYCDFCGSKAVKKASIRKHRESKHPAGTTTNFTNTKKRIRESDGSDTFSPPRKAVKVEVKRDTSLDIRSSDSSSEEEDNENSLQYSVVLGSDGKRKFSCPKCNYTSVKKNYMWKHMRTHGERLYKCYYCNLFFKLQETAYKHIEAIHKGCELKILHKKTKIIIRPTKRKKGCSPAPSPRHHSPGSSSTALDEMEVVVPKIHMPRPRKESAVLRYCCNVCDAEVEGMYKFRQHLASHPSQFTYIAVGTIPDTRVACGYCSYMAVNETDLIAHSTNHIEERRYKCGRCSYTAYIKSSVMKHIDYMHAGKYVDIIDRDKKVSKGAGKERKMVDLDPQLCLKRVAVPKQKQKKFQRIRTQVDDSEKSSDESGSDLPKQLHHDKDVNETEMGENDSLPSETEEMEALSGENTTENRAAAESLGENDKVGEQQNESCEQLSLSCSMEDENSEQEMVQACSVDNENIEKQLLACSTNEGNTEHAEVNEMNSEPAETADETNNTECAKSEDPDVKTSDNLETSSGNAQETQAFELYEENTFSHQASQGFDMGSQNFDAFQPDTLEDGVSNLKKQGFDVEELDSSKKSEQELNTSDVNSQSTTKAQASTDESFTEAKSTNNGQTSEAKSDSDGSISEAAPAYSEQISDNRSVEQKDDKKVELVNAGDMNENLSTVTEPTKENHSTDLEPANTVDSKQSEEMSPASESASETMAASIEQTDEKISLASEAGSANIEQTYEAISQASGPASETRSANIEQTGEDKAPVSELANETSSTSIGQIYEAISPASGSVNETMSAGVELTDSVEAVDKETFKGDIGDTEQTDKEDISDNTEHAGEGNLSEIGQTNEGTTNADLEIEKKSEQVCEDISANTGPNNGTSETPDRAPTREVKSADLDQTSEAMSQDMGPNQKNEEQSTDLDQTSEAMSEDMGPNQKNEERSTDLDQTSEAMSEDIGTNQNNEERSTDLDEKSETISEDIGPNQDKEEKTTDLDQTNEPMSVDSEPNEEESETVNSEQATVNAEESATAMEVDS